MILPSIYVLQYFSQVKQSFRHSTLCSPHVVPVNSMWIGKWLTTRIGHFSRILSLQSSNSHPTTECSLPEPPRSKPGNYLSSLLILCALLVFCLQPWVSSLHSYFLRQQRHAHHVLWVSSFCSSLFNLTTPISFLESRAAVLILSLPSEVISSHFLLSAQPNCLNRLQSPAFIQKIMNNQFHINQRDIFEPLHELYCLLQPSEMIYSPAASSMS
jgi:hypothetical protein